MKTQSSNTMLPQSYKQSYSPIIKQLPIVPQQSVLKLQNNQSNLDYQNSSVRYKLHYRNNFNEKCMQYQHFQVFFKDIDKNKYEVEVENDYEYPQTYLFVERVIQILNEKYNINLPYCASNYELYFAKKNGSRNSNFPDLQ